jgi:DNA mismatch repair protein MSH3
VYDEFEDGFMRGEFETRALHLQPCEIIIAGMLTSATKKVLSHLSINT